VSPVEYFLPLRFRVGRIPTSASSEDTAGTV
jgi:hypothetical protein